MNKKNCERKQITEFKKVEPMKKENQKIIVDDTKPTNDPAPRTRKAKKG